MSAAPRAPAMHIALVHMRHAETGGTERYMNQLAAHLCERGHALSIVCRSHEAPPHPAVRFVPLRRRTVGSAWRMWAFARAVEAHVGAANYDLVVGLGKTWTHDVVRLGGGCHATYLELAHRDAQRPLERWLGLDAPKQRLALEIERRALAPGAFRRAICNARMVQLDLERRHGAPPERVDVIHNGVDLERFHPRWRAERGAALRRELGLAQAQPLVLFLGTGYGRKGLRELLEAFPALRARAPRARLLVVGYDSNAARYAQLARRLGLGDCVRFAGGRRDAPACFAAADLYVLPTRYDPFANTSLEALASGLPVITTRDNGASELIEEGVHGSVLERQRAPGALARALIEWSEPERLAAGSREARELAARHGASAAMELTERSLVRALREREPAPAAQRAARAGEARAHAPLTAPGPRA